MVRDVRLLYHLCALLFIAFLGDAVSEKIPAVDVQLSVEESTGLLVKLHEENQQLRDQVSNLNVKVLSLEMKLAEARLQADMQLVSGSIRTSTAAKGYAAPVVIDPNELQMLEVNREMMVAVVSGGLRAGMKSGMKFSVVREGEVLAIVKISEVRDTIAGGLIEWNGKKGFPAVGDRLVLGSTQD